MRNNLDRQPKALIVLISGATGGVLGWLVFAAYERWADKGVIAVLLGMVSGLVAAVGWLWFRQTRSYLKIESFEVSLPKFGKVKVVIDNAHRTAGWRIFVELASRVANQSLDRREGSNKIALESLYGLFSFIRDELKTFQPLPAALQGDGLTVEVYALKILNDALRPFLSRWHPRLDRWIKEHNTEDGFPGDDQLRADLQSTQLNVLILTRGLGEMLLIPSGHLKETLPGEPDKPWYDLLSAVDVAPI